MLTELHRLLALKHLDPFSETGKAPLIEVFGREIVEGLIPQRKLDRREGADEIEPSTRVSSSIAGSSSEAALSRDGFLTYSSKSDGETCRG
jgi:hypothetical protein